MFVNWMPFVVIVRSYFLIQPGVALDAALKHIPVKDVGYLSNQRCSV